MDTINPMNPFWLLLLLAIGVFGSFHMVESTMPPTETVPDDGADSTGHAGDAGGTVPGTLNVMTGDGTFDAVEGRQMAVFAIPEQELPTYERLHPGLPKDWQHGDFTLNRRAVERVQGDVAKLGRGGAFELAVSDGRYLTCYVENADHVVDCTKAELNTPEPARLILTRGGLLHLPAGG